MDVTLDYGGYLIRTTLALLAVCGLAALVLRALRRRLVPTTAGMRVLGRLALEPRHTLYVVEVAGRCLLLGAGDGSLQTLAELDPIAARALAVNEASAPSLLTTLRRHVRRPRPPEHTEGTP